MTTTDVPDAARLESEAAEYPDERGEILIEAAAAWRRSGHAERGAALLAELAAEGGEDGCYARFQLADDGFEDGADAEAYADLARLARDPALHGGHCHLVAEMLEGLGDLPGALAWYARGVARLAPEEPEALRGPHGWMRMSAVQLRGRRAVRRQLELPTDSLDEIVPALPGQQPVEVDVDDLLAGGVVPRQIRMLVFRRAERAEARRRWPQLYEAPDEAYYPATEGRCRELAAEGAPSIRVVPADVDALCAFAERVGGSPTDSAIKTRFVDTVPDRDMLAWPPPRNSACWCGSEIKYKKCCGRPMP